MSKKIDLTGQRFGKLTVVREAIEKRNGGITWECKCDCGNLVCVISRYLKEGKVKSCGCLKKDNDQILGNKLFDKYMTGEWLKDGTCLARLTAKIPRNNTSGIKGVTRNKKLGLWTAQIKLRGKYKFLGNFINIEDAAKARKEAEEKYFTPILEKYGRLEEKK